MTRNMRLLATASVLAAAAFAASPAAAAGTAAGTTITNSITLDYKVGGVAQTTATASDTFTVDRKIVLSTVSNDATTISVSPGQANVMTTFTVTNASNATLDFALTPSQLSGGSAAHTGTTDNFNGTTMRIFVDVNNNGVYDSATDTATYIDQLAADDSRKVFVLVDIPLGRATGDVAGVKLNAQAAEATAAGSLGAIVTQTTGANTSGVDTVFAEGGASNGNVQYDGQEFALDDYTVQAAALSVTKTSRIISDPVNNTTNPKMIPGAVVEYCIAVSNAAGSATATNISISDTLPTQTTYLSAFGIKINGSVSGSTCASDGAAGGTYASGVISGALADIQAGAANAKTLVFRVTVN